MAILDFTEIDRPTKNKSKGIESKDLDAFEKFAEEFFEKIIGAKILRRTRRGRDNSLDLKIILNGEYQLVSCKHNAHSGNAVNKNQESDPVTALISNSCKKFIGFYSTGITSGWDDTLYGIKSNKDYNFDYEIYKNSDIESKLLDSNNAKGWLLAARYFPKSYANLFQRFVVPIEHYKVDDVKTRSSNSYELDGPFGCIAHGNVSKKEIVDKANDSLTSAVHKKLFLDAIKEAINLFPRYFNFSGDKDPLELSLEDISPAWDAELTYAYPVNCNVPIIVIALWSFWDSEKAQGIYLEIFNSQRENSLNKRQLEIKLPSLITIGSTAKFSSGEFRNIFSRLIAFCPVPITAPKLENPKSFEVGTGASIEWDFQNSDGLDFIVDRLLGS